MNDHKGSESCCKQGFGMKKQRKEVQKKKKKKKRTPNMVCPTVASPFLFLKRSDLEQGPCAEREEGGTKGSYQQGAMKRIQDPLIAQ